MKGIEISVVIPVYNEEECLEELYLRCTKVLNEIKNAYEIIFCDDGSTDNSFSILKKIAEKDKNVKIISFKRNYGQTAALDAGFRMAKGEIIIPMDADLQNDPEDIPLLISELGKGYDMVSGWRKKRKDKFLTKTLPSRIANFIIGGLTGAKIHDYGCTLKAYRKDALAGLTLYGEMHRFIPAYIKWAGGKISEIVVRHHPRRKGRSKYTLKKTTRVLLDLFTVRFLLQYSTKPIYMIGKYGLISIFAGFLSMSWTIIKKIKWGYPLYTDPFFLVAIFFILIGVQVILFGLIGELLMRTYFESQRKYPYLIKEKINMED